MNKLIIIAAVTVASVASFTATSAWADDITIDNQTFVSTKTRAEVRAEMLQARADGSMAAWVAEAGPAPLNTAASRLTRQEVVAEMRVSRAADFASAAMTGEDSGSFYLSQTVQPGAASSWLAKLTRAGR